MIEDIREDLKELVKCANEYEKALNEAGLAVHSPDTEVRNQAYGKVYNLRKILNGVIGKIGARIDMEG